MLRLYLLIIYCYLCTLYYKFNGVYSECTKTKVTLDPKNNKESRNGIISKNTCTLEQATPDKVYSK